MSLRLAVLGLLAEQPLHGYAIQAALEQRFAELCEPSSGEVYRALTALARDGLIAPVSARVGKRPERKVYTPTPEGRRVLDAWLRGAEPARVRVREDALWLRLLVAERCAPELLESIVAEQARRARAVLSEHESACREAGDSASFTSLVLALRLEGDVRIAQARVDALGLCGRVLARRRSGAAPGSLLREVAEARSGAGRGDVTG